jgi:hypothetical protein
MLPAKIAASSIFVPVNFMVRVFSLIQRFIGSLGAVKGPDILV